MAKKKRKRGRKEERKEKKKEIKKGKTKKSKCEAHVFIVLVHEEQIFVLF